MTELQNRLEKLVLRIDYMGMRVEQTVIDALEALDNSDVEAAVVIVASDESIDNEEVRIEQECIRLLALYQPAATDLRTICTVIKINSDLERIADLATSIAKQVKHVVTNNIAIDSYKIFDKLSETTLETLSKTVRMLTTNNANTAKKIFELDSLIDQGYKTLVRDVLQRNEEAAVSITMINLAKALERIGDLCSNIAEDVIFLKTGDIVRHSME